MSDPKYFITTEELRKDLDELTFLRKENARLLNQLHEANAAITHSVFDSKDSSDIAYNYLAKHGLIKAGDKNEI